MHRETRQLVWAAAREPGVRLESRILELLEDGFGRRLGNVRLHFSEASGAANQALGSLAFAVDGHICFTPGLDETCGNLFAWMLSHEMTHVVQKERGRQRRGFTSPGWRRLELEADCAAEALARGERVTILEADSWEGPRRWGPEGHYYTVLWASLAAGLTLEDASKNAFYAQLPDQVYELDAIVAGIEWVIDQNEEGKLAGQYEVLQGETASGRGMVQRASISLVNREFDLVSRFIRKEADRQRLWQVQTGLHALTGQHSRAETEYRKKILAGPINGATLEYGLALHAFGDSYAHRNMHNLLEMYGPPLGHLFDGHDPDIIDDKRADLYIEYGYALWVIFKRKWKKNPPVLPDDFWAGLKKVVAVPRFKKTPDGRLVPTENRPELQVKLLLDLAASALALGTKKAKEAAARDLEGIYRPERALEPVRFIPISQQSRLPMALPMSWAEFLHNNLGKNGVPVDGGYLARARECAREWTATAGQFQLYTFRDYPHGVVDVWATSPSVRGSHR